MVETVGLVHPCERLCVPAETLVHKCKFFAENRALASAPYALKSLVPLSDFRQFVSAFEGSAVAVTSASFRGLSLLCEEFGFGDLGGATF